MQKILYALQSFDLIRFIEKLFSRRTPILIRSKALFEKMKWVPTQPFLRTSRLILIQPTHAPSPYTVRHDFDSPYFYP